MIGANMGKNILLSGLIGLCAAFGFLLFTIMSVLLVGGDGTAPTITHFMLSLIEVPVKLLALSADSWGLAALFWGGVIAVFTFAALQIIRIFRWVSLRFVCMVEVLEVRLLCANRTDQLPSEIIRNFIVRIRIIFIDLVRRFFDTHHERWVAFFDFLRDDARQ